MIHSKTVRPYEIWIDWNEIRLFFCFISAFHALCVRSFDWTSKINVKNTQNVREIKINSKTTEWIISNTRYGQCWNLARQVTLSKIRLFKINSNSSRIFRKLSQSLWWVAELVQTVRTFWTKLPNRTFWVSNSFERSESIRFHFWVIVSIPTVVANNGNFSCSMKPKSGIKLAPVHSSIIMLE